MTLYDLRLVPSFRDEYTLISSLYATFSADYDLASLEPAVHYDPLESDDQYTHEESMNKKQGINRDSLDSMTDSLIKVRADGTYSILSFGEFVRTLSTHNQFDSVINVFLNFHPRTHPVLWRILITQVYLYEALLDEMGFYESHPKHKPIRPIPREKMERFDWRTIMDTAARQEEVFDPFKVAERFLKNTLREYVE